MLGYLLEVGIQYHEKFHQLFNDLPFIPERMKNWKSQKNFFTNLHDKTKYVIHVRNLSKY